MATLLHTQASPDPAAEVEGNRGLLVAPAVEFFG
jgi:hypothetical protein